VTGHRQKYRHELAGALKVPLAFVVVFGGGLFRFTHDRPPSAGSSIALSLELHRELAALIARKASSSIKGRSLR
jgi:hypothetical protein